MLFGVAVVVHLTAAVSLGGQLLTHGAAAQDRR